VVLIASNYGREHHPSWYHDLLAHPECELHIGRLNKGWGTYERRTDGIRTIPVLRVSPDAWP
jgi:F420H(2)-dependent quinone reductase